VVLQFAACVYVIRILQLCMAQQQAAVYRRFETQLAVAADMYISVHVLM
jgi:hypothetical protein